MQPFRDHISRLGGAVLGAVFLVAAWAKVMDPRAFAEQIELEGLAVLGVPAIGLALFAITLEVFLGVGLLMGLRRLYFLLTTLALVVFFLFLAGRAYYLSSQGLLEDQGTCGCFGNLLQRTPAEAFWQDLLLLGLPLALVFLKVTASRVDRWRLGSAGILAVMGFTLAVIAPDLPLDNLATRLKPGVEMTEICLGEAEEKYCLGDFLYEGEEGELWVILLDLENPTTATWVAPANEWLWSEEAPLIVALTAAPTEVLETFRWSQGPAFEIREVPLPLLRGLYRTLPRSFRIREGVVTETYSGLPPILVSMMEKTS